MNQAGGARGKDSGEPWLDRSVNWTRGHSSSGIATAFVFAMLYALCSMRFCFVPLRLTAFKFFLDFSPLSEYLKEKNRELYSPSTGINP